jgi:RecB family exonuclease
VPAYVEREFSFLLDGDRVRGRYDRVDIVPRVPGEGEPPSARSAVAGSSGGSGTPDAAGAGYASGADVVEPTLDLAPEHVTITDYKSSDVRDPAKARARAKASLQLSIYAMGYEAMTGRLPDDVALHFLESGLVGRTAVDRKRIEKARESIRTAAAGIRAGAFEPRPEFLACTYCAFREICPSSAVR